MRRDFSFFYGGGGSGYQRGEQKADWFGGKKNPSSGFEDDICIYVKIRPPENHPKHTYYDVDDNPDAVEYLKRHPEVGVIAICPAAKEYLEEVLKRKDIVCIPHDHCNYERILIPNREVKNVGIIGSTSSFQYPVEDFKKQLSEIGLDLKYEQDYWNTYKSNSEYEQRINVAMFYLTLDIQVVWRPRRWRPHSFDPFRNPNKLGNSAAFGIPTVAFPEDNFVREFDGCFIPVHSIPEMIAECKKLKDDKKYYQYYALKGLKRAEKYHIDNLEKLYLGLK